MWNVADDADHRSPVAARARRAELDLFAERVFVRPVSARHRLIDDRYGQSRRRILYREIATAPQSHAKRAEVTGADALMAGDRRIAHIERAALDAERIING